MVNQYLGARINKFGIKPEAYRHSDVMNRKAEIGRRKSKQLKTLAYKSESIPLSENLVISPMKRSVTWRLAKAAQNFFESDSLSLPLCRVVPEIDESADMDPKSLISSMV
jgi:hypothetical protein